MERKMVEREHELRGWGYEDFPLLKLRGMVDELITQYGEDARWSCEIEWESLTLKVKYSDPETDHELARRVEDEARHGARRALAQVAFDKLTPEERDALRIQRPPSW